MTSELLIAFVLFAFVTSFDEVVAVLFIAGVVARTTGPVLLAVRSRDLFAPGLYQAGLEPGRVLYAEARDDAELLAVLQEDAVADGRIHLGSADGPALRLLDLPYELDADREIQR